MFSKHHYLKVKEDHPDLGIGGIRKKLDELWRSLDATEKERYASPPSPVFLAACGVGDPLVC